MATDPVPLERDEQIRFVTWLEDRKIKFTAIPNSTYTTSEAQKALNHRTGLRAGFPDLVVLIAPSQSRDGRGYLKIPEMKRIKGSTVSPAQRDWIAALNGLGCDQIDSAVVHGASEAIEFVSEHLSDETINRVNPF